VNQEFILFQHAVNTASLLWEQSAKTTSVVTERYSHSSCYYDRSMFVFGGCTATGTTFNDLWQFDLATRQWIRPLAVGRYNKLIYNHDKKLVLHYFVVILSKMCIAL